MPHLVVLYSSNLETQTNMTVLCRALADTMLRQLDDAGQSVFPPGGTRVLAYPTAHHAVSDDGSASRAAGGSGDNAFIYLNLRMAKGRTASVHQRVGESLLAAAKTHLAPVFAAHPVGMTLQIDEGLEVFDGRHSTLHPLFNKV